MDFTSIISIKLGIQGYQAANTIRLLKEGATIPFISRYRKDQTGNLDETQVFEIREELGRLEEMEKRREYILKTIEEQGLLDEDLKKRIESADSLVQLEDIYLPFKPKKKTRAVIAREKGLEPLARIIAAQHEQNIEKLAGSYLNDQVPDRASALQGARDIIAEWVNEDERVRNAVRGVFDRKAKLASKVVKGKEESGSKYRDYFDYSEKFDKSPSHRVLAILRAGRENVLKVSLEPPAEDTLAVIERIRIRNTSEQAAAQMRLAIRDAYKRLLLPSIENEYLKLVTEKAEKEAIRVFAANLQQLLLQPPLGHKKVLAIDPGFKSGCKLVCLDEQGNLLHNQTIYPHPPRSEMQLAAKQLKTLVSQFKIDAIAIGDGRAGRETEELIKKIRFDRNLKAYVVSEDGASVYSASDIAREEFPAYDLTVRGAVSIGRRLIDPLSELVKIDPKAIGVGQYQHDVNQVQLKNTLDQVVENCVNKVGVDLNTASRYLLTYISGLGPVLAGNIVEYRSVNGPLRSREELKKIKRMGDKAFQQAAGFLRIRDGVNPLDNTAVHPEHYRLVEKMAADCGASVGMLIRDESLRSRLDMASYAGNEAGLLTLADIMAELARPGRDSRLQVKVFEFSPGINSINDLKAGMIINGIITNVTNFGAFVNIGIKQNGLVHVSNLADAFVSNPQEIVSLHQQVVVAVLEVDRERNRIQLSMKASDLGNTEKS